ncbi:MAG: helix-turn-helix domain-containing protein [Phycisphaerales bacterium]
MASPKKGSSRRPALLAADTSDVSRAAAAGAMQLGLTALEARAYAFLVSSGPCSGYRVAQALGKSIGSVYKTIEGLERAGAAATSDDAGVRIVRATPVVELAAARRAALERAVAALGAAAPGVSGDEAPDHRVYELHTRDQVLAKARALLAAATDFVLVVATPLLAAELAADMQRAAARAVHVGVKLFEPLVIEGVHTFIDARGTSAVESGPGQWLVVAADGREHVQAVLSEDGEQLSLGFTTREALMNWTLYTGMGANLLLAGVRQWVAAGATGAEIEARLSGYAFFRTPRSDGKRELLARFRTPAPRAGESRT